MPRFAANLSFLYPELPFLARFEAAARDGFQAVEFLFPYAWPQRELAERLKDNALQQVLFNAPPAGGDLAAVNAAWDAGERGLLCLTGRQSEFRFGLQLALEYAGALQCPRLHVMAGRVPQGVARESLFDDVADNLRWACAQAAKQGVTLMIEPINQRDMPGYFLHQQAQAHALLDAVDAPNLRVQMDLYHCQISEGDIDTKLRRYLVGARVGHIQIAGVPERHEPDSGELNYPYLLALIDELGYSGWVGCEYHPRLGAQVGATTAGLAWRTPWLAR
ncbi:MAG: hydroxypyruvate isomerase family protein [Gammaproteobacteria bacterium]|uniref:2-oxo-tetronate isomerase n=1 Tax=Rhodoferax sp. TaxID=50421 RepID=UPI0017D22483|nr:2-oxo-tetronate isomerase [Rhodoferax sp.]MBU3898545.1 hydroxypyruvate isomerase family protein [Gammaproteobacteria bacterium]MBA3056845.1 hydroxypyruvate isomerase family protein [Rhodoferax sp.]MBU3997872.1 hydroxypyruvate isomerase family protein [Gammaproteobacteria bacterium]MBU4079320.1 hydroxypyruvate isomerase family protein [Gammaproteobacteria bacterium]MBU4113218.1 hydroxypyruvate isomerase family protein [Gammaproteobacteria bacterium]